MPLQMARFVRKKVSAGLFNDPSEVVRDALRRVMEQEARGEPPPSLTPSELSKAKRGLQNGIKDLEEGRTLSSPRKGLGNFSPESKRERVSGDPQGKRLCTLNDLTATMAYRNTTWP